MLNEVSESLSFQSRYLSENWGLDESEDASDEFRIVKL
jgi:hypothetical protein